MSVLRAVTTPPKGATIDLKDAVARRRATLASAAATMAVLAAWSPSFSSASCFETESDSSIRCQRAAVVADNCSLARAVARSASTCSSC